MSSAANLITGLCNLRKIEDHEDPILTKDRNLKNQLSNDYTDENDESFSEVRSLFCFNTVQEGLD